ncbi:hypothetical protein M4578_11135 [Salipiger sp. P9]|uniref:hypothetical protein n=1 Tax=Salipiger pentaromativorans TaxID=2943193 RepID=UPI0021589A63|nr:hypothetical protein [Salipiger pentaromativorans]MCR8548386.1 hypothetical protein [Salipiger pentaromativorans]
MLNIKQIALSAALLGCAGPLLAADFSDPTWPCVQRKVEHLSIGLMWPAPLAKLKLTPETDRAAEELAETLALRRVDLDAARVAAEAFAESEGRDTALMGEIFARVFDKLATRRTRIIGGIGAFSTSQIALSERIDATRGEMDAQMALETPDYDRVDALEEQLDWDQRIFTDRQKTITYLCETPVLLEKRLYALAQMLYETAQPDGG